MDPVIASTPFASSGSRSETQGDASSVGSEQHTADFTAGNSTSASSSPRATELDVSSVGTGRVEAEPTRNVHIEGLGSSSSRRDSDRHTAYTSGSEEMDFPEDEALLEQAGIRTLSVIGVAASSHNLVEDTIEGHADVVIPQAPPTDDNLLREERHLSISESRHPSELAINLLVDMGFDRAAAIAALVASDNIVELAANILVGEPPVALVSASTEAPHCGSEAMATRKVAVIQAKRQVRGEAVADPANPHTHEDMHQTRRSRISISGLTSLWPSRGRKEPPKHELAAPASFSLLRLSTSHKTRKGKSAGESLVSEAVGAPGHPTNAALVRLSSSLDEDDAEADDDLDVGSLSSEDVSPDEDASDFHLTHAAAGAGLSHQYQR